MTRDEWLRAHAYLQPIARLSAAVDAAADEVVGRDEPFSRWDEYVDEFRAGVPLLRSLHAAIDLEPAGRSAVALIEALAAAPLPGDMSARTRALNDEIQREIRSPRRIVDWLLGDDSFAPTSAGLLRYLGWAAVARHWRPLVGAFDAWRDEEKWQRGQCPTCGSPPAMAQLVGIDPGRMRYLACGSCGSRWRYGRTRCPFCELDVQRLSVVAALEEKSLRIDHCEACKGYLKTYVGSGEEPLFLADWTSLHLDFVARDRGLSRRASSLYELETAPQP